MARKALKHEAAAAQRANAHINKRLRDAVESSRNSRSAASRLYQGRPSGEVPAPPQARRTEQNVLPARALTEIERVAGPFASRVREALLSAGLIGARPAARSPQPGQDRGAVSPLGGTAV
jgi:hypothetical protein